MDRLYKRPEFVDYDEAYSTFAKVRKDINNAITQENKEEIAKNLKDLKLGACQGNPIYMDLLAYYYKNGTWDLIPEDYDKYMQWEILSCARGNTYAIEKFQFLLNNAFEVIMSNENYKTIEYKNDIDENNILYVLGKNICKILAKELELFPIDIIAKKDVLNKYTQDKFIFYRKKIDEIVPKVIEFMLS